MISVTRLNNSKFWVNADMIEFIEETPDTVVSLISGNKIVIKESAETVVRAVIQFRQQTGFRPQIINNGEK